MGHSVRSKLASWYLLVLLSATALVRAMAAPLDAAEICRRVAQVYGQAHSFSIVVEDDSTNAVVDWVATKDKRRVSIEAVLPDRFHVLIKDAAFPIEIVRTRDREWAYAPKCKQWIESPARPLQEEFGPLPYAIGLFAANVSLDQQADHAIRYENKTVTIDERKVRAYVVYFRYGEEIQRISVDSESFHVLRIEKRGQVSPAVSLWKTITYLSTQLDNDPGPHAFVFRPPANAHRVDDLNTTCIPEPDITGRQARDFKFENPVTGAMRLSDLRGRIVLLAFWGSWCIPCRRELPLLDRLQRQYGEKSIQVIGITADPPWKAEEFLQQLNVHLTTICERPGEISNGYAVGGLPRLIIVDRRGVVAQVIRKEASEDQILAALHKLGL